MIPAQWKLIGRGVVMLAAVCGIFLAGNAAAQDLEPRRYVNVPVNQNFLRVAYGYSDGDVNTAPSIPLEDASVSMHGGSLAYLRTMSIGGKASSFDAYLPHLCASGTATRDGTPETRKVCGVGDARFRFTYNFVGAPALALSEYVKREKKIVVGASLQVYIPTGQYDDDKLLNIGANRWVIRPEIGLSIPLRKWSLEFSAGVRYFGDNDDFVGDQVLAQDPLYNLQAHVIYELSPRQWLSLDTNYFFGGVTYQDSVETATRQENARAGINWGVSLNSQHLLRFAAHWGVVTRIGNDSQTYSLAWTYRWD